MPSACPEKEGRDGAAAVPLVAGTDVAGPEPPVGCTGGTPIDSVVVRASPGGGGAAISSSTGGDGDADAAPSSGVT